MRYLLAVILVWVSQGISFSKFGQLYRGCDKNISQLCSYDGITNDRPKEVTCAQDISQSQLCFYYFPSCYQKDQSIEMPLWCWNCYVESPAESFNYIQFQKCLKNAAHAHLASTALVILMLYLTLS